jgi:predicted transcriptional regulator
MSTLRSEVDIDELLLDTIRKHPGVTMRELCTIMECDGSNMRKRIQSFMRVGLVKRRTMMESDRKTVYVKIRTLNKERQCYYYKNSNQP